MNRLLRLSLPAIMLLALGACAHVKVEPIEVKPIHIIHDINIRVDQQLEDFFAFEARGGAATTPSTTQSATQPATEPAPTSAPAPPTTTASTH